MTEEGSKMKWIFDQFILNNWNILARICNYRRRNNLFCEAVATWHLMFKVFIHENFDELKYDLKVSCIYYQKFQAC